MVQWVIGSILHGVDPLSYFLFLPVLHDWCNKRPSYVLSCLWDDAYKRTIAVNCVAAAGFLSHYLSGPLPYNRKIKCVECVIK